jgi:hypothetical protein
MPRNEFGTNALSVVGRGDDEGGLTSGEPIGEEIRNRQAKPLVIAVELNGVVPRIAWKNCLLQKSLDRNYGSCSRYHR